MIRLALVGYGKIAKKHLEVFRALDCEVVAACNRSEEGRNRAVHEGEISHVYCSIEEMLTAEQPEGVICCPSIHENFNVAREVIPFKIPILLEKPPGTSPAELQELCKLARQYETPVMVGLNRLSYSVLDRALLDAGGIESITYVSIEWSEQPQHLIKRGFTPEQIAHRNYSNSLHGLSLLTFLAGDIPDPNIIGLNLGAPFRWLMSLQGISERGVLATFQSTWDSPAPWRLIFGTKGRRYTFAPLETCTASTIEAMTTYVIEPASYDLQFNAGFYQQAQTFIDLIRLGCMRPELSLDEVLLPMRLAQKLTEICLANLHIRYDAPN